MFDQHQNLQNAIIKKKARIEEIGLSLAQPIPRGHPTGSRRRLIEKRLHLEKAVAELEREDRRLRSQSAARIPWARNLEAEAVASEYQSMRDIRDQQPSFSLPEKPQAGGGPASSASSWRSFRSEFKALANEELVLDPGNRRDRWLRAYVDYKYVKTEFGTWHISSGPNEDFQASFETLATRAAIALGSRKNADPLDFWLHNLFLDLLKHGSEQLFAATENEGGVILRVCEASATYCARLEKDALERPSKSFGRTKKRTPAGPSAYQKLADCAKYPTMTVREVMAVVSISRASVYRYLSEGQLDRPGLNKKAGKRSKTLILTDSVLSMLNPTDD